MSIWRRVSPSHPCPICSKCDWCAISTDGVWAICRRVDTGAGSHKVDKAGADYWLYRLDGHSPCRYPMSGLPSQLYPERADPATLDRVYRALLAALPLSSTHRQALRQRGLADRDIVQRGYRTLPAYNRATRARQLVEDFGADICARVPGLYLAERGNRQWWMLAGAVGLLIPVRDVDGRVIALKVRADHPGESHKYTYLVVTSFFPLLIGSCDIERLVVSCGSLPPLIRRVYDAPCSLSAVLVERYWSTSVRRRLCA
jgi:hypothetical protein